MVSKIEFIFAEKFKYSIVYYFREWGIISSKFPYGYVRILSTELYKAQLN
jgi:hypothetical protein